MSETASAAPDHGVVDGAPSVPPPLAITDSAPRLSAGEEARTLVAATNVANAAPCAQPGGRFPRNIPRTLPPRCSRA